MVMPALKIIWALFIAYGIYRYVSSSLKQETCKILYYLGLAVFVVQIASLVAYAVGDLYFCGDQSFKFHLDWVASTLFLLQYALLLFLFFRRFELAFKGTLFAISRRIKWTFYVVYVFWILISLYQAISYEPWWDYSETVRVFGICLDLLCPVFLISMITTIFVSKLSELSRQETGRISNETDYSLLPVATKVALLGFMACATLIIVLVIGFISDSLTNNRIISTIDKEFICGALFIFDITTNFLAVLLSVRPFGEFYFLLCGCCDAKCRDFVTRRRIGARIVVGGNPVPQNNNVTTQAAQTMQTASIEMI